MGFGIGAVTDLRTREAPDALWQALAVAGLLLGLYAFSGSGAIAELAWVAVSGLALEHLLPWDDAAERAHELLPIAIDLAAFVGVGLLVGGLAGFDGVGGRGVPVAAVAAFVSILFSRALFELRVLYGGADAKALIAASVLVPLSSSTLLALPATATRILAIYPFPLTLLMNAALLAIAVPIAIAVRNLRAGTFSFPKGFVGFSIPVDELPDRFVWLKEPELPGGEEEAEAAETSEDDRALRVRQRDALRAQGVRTAWVSPQLPFLVLMFAGAVLAVLAGNLLFDLLALL